MENPRPEKVAVVDEVRTRFESSQAVLLTEYRGIDVAQMALLRRALREAGGEYKIYKNTLVRFATTSLGIQLDELLTGPTAIAFVPAEGDGDPVNVAKALSEFAKGNDNLVIKGGLLGEKLLSAAEAEALAKVAPRDVLLARLAGGLQAPMTNMAGLLQAPLRDFAGLLKALLDDRGGAPAEASAEPADAGDADTGADETESTDDPSTDDGADASSETNETNNEPEAATDAASSTEEG